MSIDFAPCREAGLGPSDLAKLVKVSRVTASLWLNNHSQPHHLLTDQVVEVLDAIKGGVQAGLLPVPHHIHHRERGLYIENALKQATAES